METSARAHSAEIRGVAGYHVVSSPIMLYAAHYFDRAGWAFNNAHNDKLPLNVRSHLTDVAVHACQSLKESLGQIAQDNPGDKQFADAIKNLPHTELIENIRNMDLHGWPLPICDPTVRMVAMVSKPGQPIKLSSHGVAMTMRMDNLTPRFHRTPKNFKHGTATLGGATVSFGCDQGKLIIHDFSADKDYMLLDVLREFLEKCQSIIKSRMPKSSPSEIPFNKPHPRPPDCKEKEKANPTRSKKRKKQTKKKVSKKKTKKAKAKKKSTKGKPKKK